MDTIDKVVDYINLQRDRYVDELEQYLAIPALARFHSTRQTCGAQPSGAPIT